MNTYGNNVILFDGVCNLCNGFVQFIIRHDKKNIFKFASLQSDYANSLIDLRDKMERPLSTIVLQKEGKYYFKSSAALKIAKQLPFPFPMVYGLIIIPTSFRNIVYDWIADNRYRWFGKLDECWLPSPDLKKKFLK